MLKSMENIPILLLKVTIQMHGLIHIILSKARQPCHNWVKSGIELPYIVTIHAKIPWRYEMLESLDVFMPRLHFTVCWEISAKSMCAFKQWDQSPLEVFVKKMILQQEWIHLFPGFLTWIYVPRGFYLHHIFKIPHWPKGFGKLKILWRLEVPRRSNVTLV